MKIGVSSFPIVFVTPPLDFLGVNMGVFLQLIENKYILRREREKFEPFKGHHG